MSRKYQAVIPVTPADGRDSLHARPEEEIVIDWGNYPAATPGVAPQRPADDKPARRSVELASRTARVVAVLVDTIVALLPWVLGLVFLGGPLERPEMRVYRAGGVILASLALAVVQMSLVTVRGQTLGKIALGIRIVDDLDGDNPGFWRAVVLRQVVPGVIGGLPIIGQVFLLADVLSSFGEDRRCLHDLLADTKVVEA
jgi:uncharacterized RDD family membrane protein YckC